MKQIFYIILLPLYLLVFLNSAFAGGGPPPKDLLTGKFVEINSENKTAVFIKADNKETQVLSYAGSLTEADIPLNKKVMVSLDKAAGGNSIKDISIMFLDMTLQKVISLMVIGLVGGLLSGFIGSGGAFVMTPAMMSLGVPGAVAVASNMCHKFPKALVGTYKRYKYGQVDIKLALVMATSAIVGVQIGVQIQKYILANWGNAGSNLYVSVVFVLVLVIVGSFVSYDAFQLSKNSHLNQEHKASKLAERLMKIELPPMMEFKVAKIRISAWFTIPIGLGTGMLAATIAVGGFIGVPGMIYVLGASAVVASATELGIAFIMGAWGSIQWGISGLIDIRLTLLILSTSLIGVQVGALGTTYVKDYMIKVVMATTMLIVAISRGAKIPGYLVDIGWQDALDENLASVLNFISFWTLVFALGTAGTIITFSMIKGIVQHRSS